MALTPTPRPFKQIRDEIINVFVARSGINDLNEGSSIRDYIEAAAMSDYKSQGSIIAVLNSLDIDRATGSDLDKIGFASDVTRPQAKPASGLVTIGSNTFKKISTKVYAGTAAPAAGSSSVNVSDASSFPLTGAIYLGRGTSNLEGPVSYGSITPVGNYYTINLTTPTTKNHNVSESVILAQGGNRVVSAGQVVQTKANDTSASTQFTILNNTTVPDGEESVSGIQVTCTVPGTVGNVAAASIVDFASQAFPGSFVTNPSSFISGSDIMSDRDYRDLIKKSQQTKTKGTPLAIETASIGVISEDDNQTVTSAKVRESPNRNEPAILFIDNGSAYQPLIFGQGFEPVVDNAAGSEQYLQLQHEDITKATVITTFNKPYALTGGMKLSVEVGGTLSEHIFDSTDFATQNAADSLEVVNSINQNTALLFSARAVSNSQKIALFAKAFSNEDVKVVVPVAPFVDANQYLGFPTNLTYSLRLYKNDILLIKDGVIPTAESNAQGNWNGGAFVNGSTLIVEVDGTPNTTIMFLDSDFVPYGFPIVSSGNSLASFAAIINKKTPGVTASVDGDKLKLVSNKGAVDGASIQIVGGTLVTAGNMFAAATYAGKTSDYALNKATGQLELTTILAPDDVLTAGSKNTRGFTDSAFFGTGALILSTTLNDTAPRLYFILDEAATRIQTAITTSTGVTVTNPSGDNWVYTSTVPTAFTNVQVGDWALIVGKNIPDSSNNKGFWRVTAVTSASFTVRKVAGTATSYGITSNDDIIMIRSEGAIQQVELGTGTQTLGNIAASITSQLVGGFAIVQSATKVRVFTNTYALSGSIFVAGFNDPAKVLGLTIASFDQSTISHTAFAESETSELTLPEFIHDFITADEGTLPPPVVDRTIATNLLLDSLIPPNRLLSFLDAYANINNNKNLYSMTGSISGSSVLIRGNNRLRDILTNDRYFVGVPFSFSGEDNLVVIVDGDAVNKSVNIPIYRNGTVSSMTPPTLTTFTAYDTDNSPTANWPQAFGNNFDFKDFKILFKARQILDPSGSNNAMLIRYAKFGPTGNQAEVGIFYPVSPSSAVSSAVTIGSLAKINIALASDVSKVGSWTVGTQFNVTNPVGTTYRYSYNGTGASPNFTSSLPTPIAAGDIVTIPNTSPFSAGNQGTFKVTSVTAVYFEVTNASGVVESNIQLNTSSDLLFYALNSSLNTANAIGTYINNNLSDYISAAQLESGTGVISSSTLDDTASAYVQLVDGENWISSSNIGTNISPANAFVLKVTRQLPNSVSPPYSLVGEQFRIVPVLADQVSRFLNVFAVTGLSSLANLTVSSNAGKIEMYSNLFGSNGSIQVTGGTANSLIAAIENSGGIVDANFTSFNINKFDSLGLIANQWIKILNSVVQPKSVAFGSSSQLQLTNNNPSIGIVKVDIATTTYNITVSGANRVSNVVTITTTGAHGLSTDQTITIAGVTDSSFDGTFLITSTPTTTSFTYNQVNPDASSGSGTVSGPFGPGTFQVPRFHSGDATTQIKIEKQAQFVAISWTGTGTAPDFVGGGVKEGDWVQIGGSTINLLNQGIFKVAKLYGSNTIYLENSNLVEEEVLLSANTDFKFYSYDSVMPGDVLTIGGDVLGSNNNGSYTVVDSPFPSPYTIYVAGSVTSVGPVSLGASFGQIKVNEKAPFYAYRKIKNLGVDPNNPNQFTIVVNGTELNTKINQDAGSSINLISKLNFNNLVNKGEDSYKYYGGLIHAVGRTIRGDATDPTTYPGVAAAGSFIEIDSALPKRIKLSIVIRSITGTPFTVLKSRVQSVVASYVNSLGVNESVVFSQIVSAANSVDGVQAVSIASPLYDASHDIITVQPNEKAIIIDAASDIVVSLAS